MFHQAHILHHIEFLWSNGLHRTSRTDEVCDAPEIIPCDVPANPCFLNKVNNFDENETLVNFIHIKDHL